MKSIVLFFITLFYIHTSNAQTEIKDWHAVGVNWLYWQKSFGGANFFNRVQIEKDTIIQGHVLKKYNFYSIEHLKDNLHTYLSSYYQGVNKDTILSFRSNKLFWFIDPDTVGSIIRPYNDTCYNTDTIFYKLDTILNKSWSGYYYKEKIYSNNVTSKKEIIKDYYLYRLPTRYIILDNEELNNKCDIFAGWHCEYFENRGPLQYWGDVLDCYYHPDHGYISFFNGQCDKIFSSKIEKFNIEVDVKVDFDVETKTINILNLEDKTIELKILNNQGKEEYSSTIQSTKNLQLDTFSAGVYFLLIRSDSHFQTKKIFIR